MDVIKLAKKSTKEYMPGCAETIMQFKIASDMFIRGYNAACEWKDIETFDKSKRDSILIAHIVINDEDKEEYEVCEGFWDDFWNRWCTSWESIIDKPVAWMPLPKYTHKP